jgi:hypothetical protein
MNKKSTQQEKELLRQQYVDSRRVDLTSYAGMIGEGFNSQIDRLSQIIGGAHEPSLGSYKERLLAEVIRNFIPKRYSVGTGFVLFPTKANPISRKAKKPGEYTAPGSIVSKQLDIIVYDGTNYPNIFTDGDFVIVRPESVRAIIEVKGFLNTYKADEFMDLFIDFGKKWRECDLYYRNSGYTSQLHYKKPGLYLMCWRVAVGKDGRPKGDGGRLRNKIASTYKKLPKSLLKDKNFPVLDNAYIYKDCCVDSVVNVADNNEMSFGFHTVRGQFVVYDEKGKAKLGGDKTIASLLAGIQFHLDTPFNPKLSHLDQTNRLDVLPHKLQGYDKWLEGDDIQLILKESGD